MAQNVWIAFLNKTAKFFRASTKRWAALRKVAATVGYHLNHGPRRRSPDVPARLLKYQRLVESRYVFWKAKAARVWINNLKPLQKYLEQRMSDEKAKAKAKFLKKRSSDVFIVGAMHCIAGGQAS